MPNINQLLIEGDKISNKMHLLEEKLDLKQKIVGFEESDINEFFKLMALSIRLDEITKNIQTFLNLQQLMDDIVHNPSN